MSLWQHIVTIRTYRGIALLERGRTRYFVSVRAFMPSGETLVEYMTDAPTSDAVKVAVGAVEDWIRGNRPGYTVVIDPEIYVPRSLT